MLIKLVYFSSFLISLHKKEFILSDLYKYEFLYELICDIFVIAGNIIKRAGNYIMFQWRKINEHIV